MNILLILISIILLIYINDTSHMSNKNLSKDNKEITNLFIILVGITLIVYIYDTTSNNNSSLLEYLSNEQRERSIIIKIDTPNEKLFLRINVEFLDKLFNILINLIKKIIYKNERKLENKEIMNLLPNFISQNCKNILKFIIIMLLQNNPNNEYLDIIKIKLLSLMDKYINFKDLQDYKKLSNNNKINDNINIINDVTIDIPEIFCKIFLDMTTGILNNIILLDAEGNIVENKNTYVKVKEFVKILNKYLPEKQNYFDTSFNKNVTPSTTKSNIENNNQFLIKVISTINDPEGIKNGKYREVPNNKIFNTNSKNWNISIKFNLDKFNNKIQCIIGNMSNNLNNWGLWINPLRIIQWSVNNSNFDLNNFGQLKDNTLYMISMSYYNNNYYFSLTNLSSNNLVENFNVASTPIIFSANPINTNIGSITFGGDFIQANLNTIFLGTIFEIKSADVLEIITTPLIKQESNIRQESTTKKVTTGPVGIDKAIFNDLKRDLKLNNIYQEIIKQENTRQESTTPSSFTTTRQLLTTPSSTTLSTRQESTTPSSFTTTRQLLTTPPSTTLSTRQESTTPSSFTTTRQLLTTPPSTTLSSRQESTTPSSFTTTRQLLTTPSSFTTTRQLLTTPPSTTLSSRQESTTPSSFTTTRQLLTTPPSTTLSSRQESTTPSSFTTTRQLLTTPPSTTLSTRQESTTPSSFTTTRQLLTTPPSTTLSTRQESTTPSSFTTTRQLLTTPPSTTLSTRQESTTRSTR